MSERQENPEGGLERKIHLLRRLPQLVVDGLRAIIDLYATPFASRQETLEEQHKRVEEVLHLPIAEAERALGVRSYTPDCSADTYGKKQVRFKNM